jgi:hypothetical protein
VWPRKLLLTGTPFSRGTSSSGLKMALPRARSAEVYVRSSTLSLKVLTEAA